MRSDSASQNALSDRAGNPDFPHIRVYLADGAFFDLPLRSCASASLPAATEGDRPDLSIVPSTIDGEGMPDAEPYVPAGPENLPVHVSPAMASPACAEAPLLTQAVYLSGRFESPPLCCGLARCGRCRMRFLPQSARIPEPLAQDCEILGQQAVEQGWRLGCRHIARDGAVVELPENIRPLNDLAPVSEIGAFIVSAAKATYAASDSSFEPVSAKASLEGDFKAARPNAQEAPVLAVDFGSTSLQYTYVPMVSADGSDEKDGPSGDHEGEGETSQAVKPGRQAEVCCSGSMVNPQMGAGSDIMSRLGWAANPAGREQLGELSERALRRIIMETGVENRPGEVVVAANPAMTYLLLKRDAAGLRAAPYKLDYYGGVAERLPGLPPLWFCPLISPFVGGDISAGFVFLACRGVPAWPAAGPAQRSCALNGAEPFEPRESFEPCKPFKSDEPHSVAESGESGGNRGFTAKSGGSTFAGSVKPAQDRTAAGPVLSDTDREAGLYPFLLADLGTNGEFLLALDEERALATSLPLGPALEGMGMSCGAEARGQGFSGVATSFALNQQGLSPHTLPPEAKVGAVSATGYLSLLHNLLRLGLVDEDGLFVRDPAGLSPLARRVASGFGRKGAETVWFVNDDIYLSAADVEELLKVKASFRLALDSLLAEAGLEHSSLRALYLAGNLGRHVDADDLSALGFVPESLRGRIVPVGNSALAGATLLARRKELREPLRRWAARVRTLDLTAALDFHKLFTSAMNFRQ